MEAEIRIRIDDFINDVQSVAPQHVAMIESIRLLFTKLDRTLKEDIKYGGLVFVKYGSLVAGIFPYKAHISIEFSNGADFSDPSSLLEGKGKRRRHLKIFEAEDIADKDISFFIKQAVQ
jgi:hypothetical protein